MEELENFECNEDCKHCEHQKECIGDGDPIPRFGIYAGDEVCVNDYIELKRSCCDEDRVRGGTVIKVFRDSNRVQRMVKFKDDEGFVDYCSLDEIDLLEPYSR